MDINDHLGFHRVHRINIPDRNDDYPRPIVAKFERSKDREYVRMQALKTLRGKSFGMREQFPNLIENRRKSLYSEMRKARQNKQNKVRLVKKKLYINNIQYITNYQNHQRQRSWETPRDFSRDRTFKRSANCGRYNNGLAPRQTFVGKAVNFASPNMYTHLPRDDDLVNTTGRSENRHLSRIMTKQTK